MQIRDGAERNRDGIERLLLIITPLLWDISGLAQEGHMHRGDKTLVH